MILAIDVGNTHVVTGLLNNKGEVLLTFRVASNEKMTEDERRQAEEQERGFRYAELEIRDRESARDRDSNLAHAGIKNYRADSMYFLSVVVICVLVYLTWKDGGINEYVKGIITLVLGRFLGYLDNIYNFEFGTTRGSALKSELLAKASPVKD